MAWTTLVDVFDMESYFVNRRQTEYRAEWLAKSLGLERQFQYLSTNMSTSLSYHNTLHMKFVMCKCAELYEKMGLDTTDSNFKSLILAAMFHDYDHSGGVLHDSDNISAAMYGLHLACDGYEELSDCEELAKEIIYVTEYPFIHEPVTPEERIIRDADILQGCTPFFQKIIYVDLYSELLTSKPDLKFVDYVRGQQKFLTEATMYTEIGRVEKESFIDAYAKPFWKEVLDAFSDMPAVQEEVHSSSNHS